MSPTRLIAASSAALAAVCCLVLLVPTGAPARTARIAATCTPDARTPVVLSGRTGYADGYVWCGWPPPSYGYTIRMVNRAGSALITKTGWYGGGTQSWNTPTVPCAGAWVHTFLYINVSGAGKSDSSGDTYC